MGGGVKFQTSQFWLTPPSHWTSTIFLEDIFPIHIFLKGFLSLLISLSKDIFTMHILLKEFIKAIYEDFKG